MGKITNRQRSANAISSRKPFRSSPSMEHKRYRNERPFESQHTERRVYEHQFLCFGGRYDHQRTLVIPITAITLASDSRITITRVRPSKLQTQHCEQTNQFVRFSHVVSGACISMVPSSLLPQGCCSGLHGLVLCPYV